MNTRAKNLIKSLIPPILLRPKPRQYGYFGNYQNWEEVANISSGYSSDTIIRKVRESALKVKNGTATYERDGVVFSEVQMSWPLLASLLWIANQNNGRLEIIDYGGSLGTSYFQNRNLLKNTDLHWHIVEQDKFVEIGKKEFTDASLDFYYNRDLPSLVQEKKPNVMIISSSLQFLPDPITFLEKISGLNIQYVIFDKIPFFADPKASKKLMLQKVPPKIYDASYPVWIFGYDDVLSGLRKKFDVISEFSAYDGYKEPTSNGDMMYRGFFLKKK